VHAMILVVAPDSAFRLSLRFMLESEGYDVVVPRNLEEVERLRRTAACTIVDHEVLADMKVPLERLLGGAGPLVLLADTLDEMPQAGHIRTIEKPLLGSAVVNAVHDLLEQARHRDLRGAT